MPTFDEVLANTDTTTHTNRLHAAFDEGKVTPLRPTASSALFNYPAGIADLRPATIPIDGDGTHPAPV